MGLLPSALGGPLFLTLSVSFSLSVPLFLSPPLGIIEQKEGEKTKVLDQETEAEARLGLGVRWQGQQGGSWGRGELRPHSNQPHSSPCPRTGNEEAPRGSGRGAGKPRGSPSSWDGPCPADLRDAGVAPEAAPSPPPTPPGLLTLFILQISAWASESSPDRPLPGRSRSVPWVL